MNTVDRLIRKVIPSAAHLSYNPVFKVIGNGLSALTSLIYPEFRELPPNHLRVRVGVNNKLLFNQVYHLWLGMQYWIRWLNAGYVKTTSDVAEIGCGCGRIAHPLREAWFEGTYLGIDIDEELLDWCTGNFPSEKFTFQISAHKSATYVTEKQEEGARFSFAEANSKDFIYSTSLYTHLLVPELTNYTQESYRALRENGVMCMTFFCMESVELGGRWSFQHRVGEAYVENLKLPEAAVAYTKDFVSQIAHSAGFANVEIILSPVQSWLVCRK